MKILTAIAFAICLLLISNDVSTLAQAQATNACADMDVDPRSSFLSLLQIFADDPLFDVACANYEACATNAPFLNCEAYFYPELLLQCADNDRICRLSAQLTAGLVGLSGSYRNVPWAELITQVNDKEMLTKASDADILGLFDSIPLNTPGSSAENYLLGVLHSYVGDVEIGRSFFDLAIMQGFDNPLYYWVSAEYAAGSGDIPRAQIDYFQLSLTGILDKSPARALTDIAAFVERHPIDFSAATDYILYPTERVDGGMYGAVTVEIRDEGAPIQLLKLNGFYILRFEDTDERLTIQQTVPNPLVLYRNTWSEEFHGHFRFRTAFQYDSYPYVDVALNPGTDGHFEGTIGNYHENGGIQTSFVLAPANEPDPRTLEFRCPNSPRPRLKVGEQAVVGTPFGSTSFFDKPGGEVVWRVDNAELGEMTVVDGPECTDGTTWWHLRHYESGGWTSENYNATGYILLPSSWE